MPTNIRTPTMTTTIPITTITTNTSRTTLPTITIKRQNYNINEKKFAIKAILTNETMKLHLTIKTKRQDEQ